MSTFIRNMLAQDLIAVERVQADVYSGSYLESSEAIAQRFNVSPETAWVAELHGDVCAYLVCYWSRVGKINPLNAQFQRSDDANCLYLHDLALLNSVQGFGIAKLLINVAEECAKDRAVSAMALISVQNSKQFWEKFGFRQIINLDAEQSKNICSYCVETAEAYYMVKYL